MGAFRKRDVLTKHDPVGSTPVVTVPVTKTVVTKDNPEPTVYVEMKTTSVDEYASTLGLPCDEDYQLRDMLASGRVPDEVPVSGILDSNDPTDLCNIGVGDTIFEKLSSEVDSKAAAAAAAAKPTDTPPAE